MSPLADSDRPLLNPALRRLWRDGTTLQLGLDCHPALVVHGVDPATRWLLDHLDGRHTPAELEGAAADEGHDRQTVRRLLADLGAAGALLPADPRALRGLGGPAEIDRLGPDLASTSLLARDDGLDPVQRMIRRRTALVVVHGATRVGVPLAASLAAAGVGRVSVADTGRVLLAEATPGGVLPTDEDRPRRSAAHDAVRRSAPTVRTAVGPHDRPDLAVLCDPWPGEDLRAVLHAAGTPHLAATVRETTGVVGPLVLPGQTGCLACIEHHRGDRDRGWPALLAQLAGRRRRAADALDGPLGMLVAAAAALQALAFLDTRAVPTAVREASIEVRLPDWPLRRRSWPPHPRCRCGATAAERLTG